MTLIELAVILFLASTAYVAAVAGLVYWIMNRPTPKPW